MFLWSIYKKCLNYPFGLTLSTPSLVIIISGVFTAPRAGVYLITYSYKGRVQDEEHTFVYIYKNGSKLAQTEHSTDMSKHGYGKVTSTGGRSVYQRLEAGDTIRLQADDATGHLWRLLFCIQFINN